MVLYVSSDFKVYDDKQDRRNSESSTPSDKGGDGCIPLWILRAWRFNCIHELLQEQAQVREPSPLYVEKTLLVFARYLCSCSTIMSLSNILGRA